MSDRLNDEIKNKRPHLLKKNVLFNHNTSSANESNVHVAECNELRFQSVLRSVSQIYFSTKLVISRLRMLSLVKRFASTSEIVDTDSLMNSIRLFFKVLPIDFKTVNLKNSNQYVNF